MKIIRRQLQQHRSWLRWLLLCVAFRATIPVGFMPQGGGDLYSWITLCSGNTGSAQLLSLSREQPESHINHSHHHSHDSHITDIAETDHAQHKHAEHSYCLFAGIALNATGAEERPALINPGPSDKPPTLRDNFSSSQPFHLHFARATPTHFHPFV